MERKQPSLTVDAVVARGGKVLLVRRKRDPFRGKLAFPGGFVKYGERVEDAVVREAMEETGYSVRPLGVVGVYSDPHRDPRGHVVTVAFVGKITGGKLRAGDDAKEAAWCALRGLDRSRLAFDHARILKDYLGRKK